MLRDLRVLIQADRILDEAVAGTLGNPTHRPACRARTLDRVTIGDLASAAGISLGTTNALVDRLE